MTDTNTQETTGSTEPVEVKIFYIADQNSMYKGFTSEIEINRWIDVLSKLHPKDEGEAYTLVDYLAAYLYSAVTEIAPPDVNGIDQFVWNDSTKVWNIYTAPPLTDLQINREQINEVTLQRQAAYAKTDAMKLKIDETVMQSGRMPTVEDYKPWLDAKAAIREQFPMPDRLPLPPVPTDSTNNATPTKNSKKTADNTASASPPTGS